LKLNKLCEAMEEKIDRYRKLADYIYDDLSVEEAGVIEKEISTDPQWSDSYQLNRQVKDFLQAKIQLEDMRSDPLLEEAQKLAEMAFDPDTAAAVKSSSIPSAPKRNRRRTLAVISAVAAGLAIILAVGILPSHTDQDRLYDRYYTPLEASDYTQRGDATQAYRNIALGINLYLEGNYGQSIDQFHSLSSEPAFQSEMHFFTGLSYLGLGQYSVAQNHLETVLEGNNRYQAETLWYLGLSYLKTGNYEQANQVMTELELYDGLYQKNAQSLRKKLRRLTP
jgi:TolA-binding protein